MPPQPINRAAMPMLQQAYQGTENGDQLFLYDTQRVIIFSSQQSIHFLSNSAHWFGDGTFKVWPATLFQLYTACRTRRTFSSICIYFSSK